MADPSRVPAGALAPVALRYWLSSRRLDLTKIVSARFVLRRQNGRGPVQSWTATVSEKTPSRALLTRPFEAGDVPDEDLIVFEPRVILAGPTPEIVGASRTLAVFGHPSRL